MRLRELGHAMPRRTRWDYQYDRPVQSVDGAYMAINIRYGTPHYKTVQIEKLYGSLNNPHMFRGNDDERFDARTYRLDRIHSILCRDGTIIRNHIPWLVGWAIRRLNGIRQHVRIPIELCCDAPLRIKEIGRYRPRTVTGQLKTLALSYHRDDGRPKIEYWLEGCTETDQHYFDGQSTRIFEDYLPAKNYEAWANGNHIGDPLQFMDQIWSPVNRLIVMTRAIADLKSLVASLR